MFSHPPFATGFIGLHKPSPPSLHTFNSRRALTSYYENPLYNPSASCDYLHFFPSIRSGYCSDVYPIQPWRTASYTSEIRHVRSVREICNIWRSLYWAPGYALRIPLEHIAGTSWNALQDSLNTLLESSETCYWDPLKQLLGPPDKLLRSLEYVAETLKHVTGLPETRCGDLWNVWTSETRCGVPKHVAEPPEPPRVIIMGLNMKNCENLFKI